MKGKLKLYFKKIIKLYYYMTYFFKNNIIYISLLKNVMHIIFIMTKCSLEKVKNTKNFFSTILFLV